MTAMVVAIPLSNDDNGPDSQDHHVKVAIHIEAEVLDAEVARRKASEWLLDNVGNLLGATMPELLVVDEHLFWRFDVILGVPNLAQPGSGALYKVGQISLDATTGAIENPDDLIQELQTSAASIVR
jgi:hypothetical protein